MRPEPAAPSASPSPVRPRPDPITVEVVRNGLLAITEEMKANLMRTAYNLIIYEALDFTVGLFTAAGETISIGLGLPMFIRGMAETVKAVIGRYGLDGLEPGDILLTNDAYITGSHLNHVTLVLPVFHREKLIGFTACMAHWIDIGGSLGGATTDIYSEGLQLPILKYRKAGEINRDLVEIIALNVRLPELALGDLRAQLSAVTTGERRFLELVARHGWTAVEGSIASLMDQSEALARSATQSIPDGVYEASSFLDDDGVEIDRRIPVKVRVEVRGDAMTIDLSGVSEQVRGYFNAGTTTGIGLAQVAYKCLTSPQSYPVNDGAFRALEVIMPPGLVVSAQRPAPMRMWMTFPMTVIDTIFRALAEVVPDRVIAGHHADLCIADIHGVLPAEGRFFRGMYGPIGGGWGAKATEDGVSATVCINDGDTHNGPTEQLEAKYPVLVERYALRPDSGGPGRFRGGLGVEAVLRALAPFTANTFMDRMHCPPWGLRGGGDASGNAADARIGGAWRGRGANAKLTDLRLAAGDALKLQSGGGGGFGPALTRDSERVRSDVVEGYVSLEAAARDYGVVLDPSALEIDEAATLARRGADEASDG